MRSFPFGILAFALLPGVVVAQQPEGSRPFSLDASVTTGTEYTDNFFRKESNPQSNFRHSITPDVALHLTGPFARANLRYHPTAAYATLVKEPEHFQAVDADAAYDVTPFFTAHATDKFLQSDTPSITDPNTLQVKRFTITQNIATLELPYLTETLTVTPRGAWTASKNASDTPLTDERSRILTLGVDGVVTLVPLNTTVKASGESTRARFRLAGDFTGQAYKGSVKRPFGPRFDLTLDGALSLRQPDRSERFTIRDVGMGAHHQFSETASLSGHVGYQMTDVTEQPGRQGLTYSTQASYTRAAFTFATSSDLSIQETFTEVQNVGVVRTQNLEATLTYQATEDLQVKGTGKWSSTTSLQSPPSGTSASTTTGQEQKSTVLTWNVSASYQVTRTIKLTGSWENTRRDSTPVANNFAANTLKLELSVDFK